MLTITVVDLSAESRSKIAGEIQQLLAPHSSNSFALPRVKLRSSTPTEARFQDAPDICVIGEELAETQLHQIATIRKVFSNTAILVRVRQCDHSIDIVKESLRLGADDLISIEASEEEFLKRLLFLSRRAEKSRSGTLVVVLGAKGGVGATSVVAAIGDCLSARNEDVALVDMDFESQDLSRFLQAKPFVNERLSQILSAATAASDDVVREATSRVWENENLYCVSPPIESYDLVSGVDSAAKGYHALLEMLDEQHSYVVVDVGHASGTLLDTLIKIADVAVLVINRDPSSSFAALNKTHKIKSLLAADSRLLIVENESPKGVQSLLLQQEFGALLEDSRIEWGSAALPYSAVGSKWPASGATLFSLGSKSTKTAISELVSNICSKQTAGAPRSAEPTFWGSIRTIAGYAMRRIELQVATVERKPKALALPETTGNEELSAKTGGEQLISRPNFLD